MAAKPITLTADQLRHQTAQELLALLVDISADGILTDEEIVRLDAWLAKVADKDVPALTFLRSKVKEVLADRVIIEEERRTIVAAILRVLPPEESVLARVRFSEAARRPDEEPLSVPSVATDGQLRCLKAMGVAVPPDCTAETASALIGNSLATMHPVTNRQMMVLRFWNKAGMSDKGRAAVSEWMDGWYAENPERLVAWELWKSENGDCGRQDPPEKVPVGIGDEYLGRVEADRAAAEERPSNPRAVRIGWAVAAIVGIVVIAYYAIRATHLPPPPAH